MPIRWHSKDTTKTRKFSYTKITFCKACTLSKIVLQTNFPRIGKTYIFRPGRKSTFTWTMPYKSIPVLVIT